VGEVAEKVQKTVGRVVALTTGASALTGSLGDFLRPLGNINLVVCLIATAAAPILLLLARRKGGVKQKRKMSLAGLGGICIARVFGVWTALAAPWGSKGFLAKHIEPVATLQERVWEPEEAPSRPPLVKPQTTPTTTYTFRNDESLRDL